MDLTKGELEKDYIVKSVSTDDEELNEFLFSLGCYKGESIRIISRSRTNCVITVKNARYNIDMSLASAIEIE